MNTSTETMAVQEIGVATLDYNQDGSFKQAKFAATMKVDIDGDLMSKFMQIECRNGEYKIMNDANSAMAVWFQRINEIELADRAQYTIASELISCGKHENGVVSSVQIRFVFKHL